MGCHTWFSVPIKIEKEEIIKKAKENLKTWVFRDSERKMYQFAIDNELPTPVCNLAIYKNIEDDWIVYQDIKKHSLEEYNKLNNTNYTSIYDKEVYGKIKLESYSEEPRIGGYPDKIIHSYQEMIDFMATGFDNEEGEHFDFYYEDSRKESFMLGIKTFFEKHPKGIIKFG